MAEPELSRGDAPPDLMNDPQYATNTTNAEDGTNEPDTCRICRGEAAENEPLFYPCKCSGSIKFVHQDCLMEWLSHSQKKHCELCKTPFRFTKLYSPHMPQQLPTSVFARHLAINTARNITTWLRFCLVITVWLGILPYVIRQVWRFLFWFSDGGWPSRYLPAGSPSNSTAVQAMEIARELQLATLTGNGTSPVTPILASQTTSASIGGVMDKLVGFLMPFSQSLNISGSDPLAAGFIKSLYYGFGLQNGVAPDASLNNTGIPRYTMSLPPTNRSPSLLSEVAFFKNLTRSPPLNSLVVNVTEGYIITLLVVVSFILVFLIREWVVQQQPGINMGAGFNAEFAGGGERRRNREPRNGNAPILPNRDGAAVQAIERPPDRRPMARPRGRRVRFDDDNLGEEGNVPAARHRQRPEDQAPAAPDLDAGPGESSTPSRPILPVRDALDPAAEVQRRLMEEPKMTKEFLNIWQRAGADPAEVLRIIEREGHEDQMAYWVGAMKILQNPNGGSVLPVRAPRALPGFVASESTGSGWDLRVPPESSSADAHMGSERSSTSSTSWVDVAPLAAKQGNAPTVDSPATTYEDTQELPSKGKGKEKASDEELLLDSMSQVLPGMDSVGRLSPYGSGLYDARATKDISSMHNTWSFANLPPSELSPASHGNEENTALFGSGTAGKSGPDQSNVNKGLSNEPIAERAWKDAQTLRVQEAIERGREAQRHMAQPKVTSNEETDGAIHIQGQDGTTSVAPTWDDVFENNSVAASDGSDPQNRLANMDDFEQEEMNPADDQLEGGAQRANGQPLRPVEPQGFLGRVADWLWGRPDNERRQDDPGVDDEHVVGDLAAEAPFVPRQLIPNNNIDDHGLFDDNRNLMEQDREVVEAAIAAGLDPNDPDGIDDAEDFEGIMELVGMRGPLTGLVQNALFSAFLLALAVAIGVWIPYNIGRVALLFTANPGPAFKLPLRLVFGCAAFLQDCALAFLGFISWIVVAVVYWPLKLVFYLTGTARSTLVEKFIALGTEGSRVAYAAFDHGMTGTVNGILTVADSDLLAFSAASHESLISLKSATLTTLTSIGSTIRFVLTGEHHVDLAQARAFLTSIMGTGWQIIAMIPTLLARPDSWVISLEVTKRVIPLDPELSIWNSWDRFWATFSGYTALSILGSLYLHKGSPFSNSQVGREWEATIIDLLHQAGGVMKVILIISIEMLVFPLYCGLLLDVALLPLFENTTVMSRILFTFNSPLTSIFVHWFVGTCYMFHFALFVSMCRKIMRKGVLYFIRDPDDPTFHPVRDVLERNVATQLRKILFSALVYGALVVICLGGVVWGLAFAFEGVLPIHWSSNEPVLEFPIDLLFYNFLMPLAVKFFKPSDGLHAMYSWWFRRCARMLRLTWFMFDERRVDEEGHYAQQAWGDILRRLKGEILAIEPTETNGIGFVSDGRYVRTPASDQVRIPKDSNVFLEVNEANERIDGVEDRPDGLHGKDSALFKQVYIPPHFRLRIFLFILSIWIFAAFTGVSITIVPLVFGRQVFARLIPSDVRKNDVYAFSIGIYILGSILYAVLHVHSFVTYLRRTLSFNSSTPQDLYHRLVATSSRVARIAWTYAAFLFVLPTLSAFLIEFYLLIPIHTYFATGDRHVVHFVQAWTLGLLYVKLISRIILWYEDSRPAEALRAITRNGYLNPDARLATRSFIFPATMLLGILIAVPWGLASLACKTVFKEASERQVMLVFRYAYPMVLGAGLMGLVCWVLMGIVKGWRQRIKDEVYLIGERLHNFGDNRKVGAASAGALAGVRRIDT